MEENKKVETEEVTTEKITENNNEQDIIEETQEPKNNKKRNIIIGVICLLVLCVAGYFFLNQKKEKVYDITYPESLSFEYGSNLSELISVSNADKLEIKVLDLKDIEIKDIELNKDYKLEIKVFDKDKVTTLYKEGVKFVDTTAPEIELKTTEVEIPTNHIVLKIEATATDNYDKSMKVEIDSKEVDITKVGTYKAYAIAKDTSGNETKVEVPVKVVEEKDLSETAKETVKKQIEEYKQQQILANTNTTNTTQATNTSANANTTNNNPKSIATNNSQNGKSQEQIAAEEKAKQKEAQRQAEAQKQAELDAKKAECEAQWGKWNGSSCTWDQPAEQPSVPEVAQPQTSEENTGGRDDGCSVSAKLAEYEAYYNEWSATNGGAWSYSYDPGSGALLLYIHNGDGRGISETIREYYCKQP